jgi:carbon monoxide dehydrogenase subunit G
MYTAEASVNVNANQQTAWEYVSNYQNFDQFMPNITRIELLAGDTSEWHVSGPLGIPVSWKAITSVKESPSHLSWHSVEGSIDTKGFIKLEPYNSGSKITVHMEYTPPLGAVGEAFASLFKDPQKMLEDGLEKLGEILSGGSVNVKDKDETRASEANRGMTTPMNSNSSSTGGSTSLGDMSNRDGTSLTNDSDAMDRGTYDHGDSSLSGSNLNNSSSDSSLDANDNTNLGRNPVR